MSGGRRVHVYRRRGKHSSNLAGGATIPSCGQAGGFLKGRRPRRLRHGQLRGAPGKSIDFFPSRGITARMQNVLITGGAGYVGHVLTPRLLSEGYNVTVYDALYFGCRLPNDPKLRVIQGDIRDTPKLAATLAGQDAVLHLACISNDASFELDEKLSETINYDCFEPLVMAAKKLGVKRLVYCSSSSVYGV